MIVEGVQINEEREELDTHQMLMDGFLENLKKASDIDLSGYTDRPTTSESKSIKPEKKNYNTESLLSSLFDVHDDMVGLFSTLHHSSVTASNLSKTINKVGTCISMLGGKVQKFSAMDYVSGLQAPDLRKNASKVIDTTKQCYTLGEILNDSADNSGRTINITFSGVDGETHYKAIGTISANSGWNGNEAIDYIYSAGSGKLSVKSFEGNRWIDRSENYDITWDLEEYSREDYERELNSQSKKKVEASQIPNKSKAGHEDESVESVEFDFPIEEK